MPVFSVTETMLYCPKCQQKYEEGTQRFCSNEGERLLRVPAHNTETKADSVFSSVLGRTLFEETEQKAKPAKSKSGRGDARTGLYKSFTPPATSKIFKAEPETNTLPEPEAQAPKQSSRIIKPDEIPPGQARLGDRKTSPNSRAALSWENPQALIEQTIKGRYLIIEEVGKDENSLVFLAEDRIINGKKVLVKVLMDEDAQAAAVRKLFAEERISLSHINHPNVANVIDSGELPEGKPFIVSEYVEGNSVKDVLTENGQFNALRAARIIRQVSHALSEIHGSGIVHRNLMPENIILTVSENGAEQVKLINFGVSKGELNKQNILYKAPEQIERKPTNIAGDIYSLAVVAYQMLTNRLPFKASSKKDFLKAQHAGFVLRPTDLRFDLPPAADEVLEKALAFEPADRFTNAREFGDAFFNALTAEKKEEAAKIETTADKEIDKTEETAKLAPVKIFEIAESDSENESTPVKAETNTTLNVSGFENVEIAKEKAPDKETKPVKDLLWEKRSPEPPHVASTSWNLFSFLGVALLLAGFFGVWYYWINRPVEQIQPNTETVTQPISANALAPKTQNSPTLADEIEVPPLPRSIAAPPETIFFENSKQNVKGVLLRNYLGFSLYYPKDWTRNVSENKFLDVSKKSASGIPVEQMLIGYYESKGTFKADKETFPLLVENSNKDLKSIIPNYQNLSEGEIKINGWRAYEVKFQGAGAAARGEKKLILWGRRLWIPAARPGIKSGYVITLLATSLSPEVTSVDDVGAKGELATILQTFEPNQNF